MQVFDFNFNFNFDIDINFPYSIFNTNETDVVMNYIYTINED